MPENLSGRRPVLLAKAPRISDLLQQLLFVLLYYSKSRMPTFRYGLDILQAKMQRYLEHRIAILPLRGY